MSVGESKEERREGGKEGGKERVGQAKASGVYVTRSLGSKNGLMCFPCGAE